MGRHLIWFRIVLSNNYICQLFQILYYQGYKFITMKFKSKHFLKMLILCGAFEQKLFEFSITKGTNNTRKHGINKI